MSKRTLERFSVSALFAGALLLPPLQAHAGDSSAGNDWRYDASLYRWGAGVGGSGDVDVGFDTVVNSLNIDNLNLSGPLVAAHLHQ